MIDLKKEGNFFETRVAEYQTGGRLVGCNFVRHTIK